VEREIDQPKSNESVHEGSFEKIETRVKKATKNDNIQATMPSEKNIRSHIISLCITSACLRLCNAHMGRQLYVDVNKIYTNIRMNTPSTPTMSTMRMPEAFIGIGSGYKFSATKNIRRSWPAFSKRHHSKTISTPKLPSTSTALRVFPPPGSGYKGPEDEPDFMPEGYKPMMQYPGTMRPTMEKENIPFEDLPLDDDDEMPVPFPNFQDLPFYHHWGSPHPMQMQMEVFIEREGRWLSPEDEEEIDRGSKAGKRGTSGRQQRQQVARPNVVIDDDEDDDDEDLLAKTSARIRGVAEKAASRGSSAMSSETDVDEDGDDLLGALGLGNLDDEDIGSSDEDGETAGIDGEEDETDGDLLVSFEGSSAMSDSGMKTPIDSIDLEDEDLDDMNSELNEDNATDQFTADEDEESFSSDDNEFENDAADDSSFGEFDGDYSAEDSFDDIEDMDSMLGL